MTKPIYLKCLLALLMAALAMHAPEAFAKEKKRDFVVTVDAGHGGKDTGAADNGVREKDINLGVAKKLAEILRKKLKNSKVVLTRDDDTFLSLQERADVANKAKSDLFISIHTNSLDKSNKNRKNVEGSSVYALGLHKDANNMKVAMRENAVIELEGGDFEERYSGFDPSSDESYIIFEIAQKKNLTKSVGFARDVQKELVRSGRVDRGVHQAGFWVLWATSMPSVLVELDFICNPKSASYISSDKGAKELASAIAEAVVKYEKNWRRQLGDSSREARDVAVEETHEEVDRTPSGSDDAPVVLARSSRQSDRKSVSSGRNDDSYAKARSRRRRSAGSRSASSARNVETTGIPEAPESRTPVRETTDVAAPSSAEDGQASADRNSGKKSDKKDRKKDKKKKDKKKDKGHKARRDKVVTVYKIQVLATPNEISSSSPRFQGFSPISVIKEGNLYKYTYGESENKSEIETLLKKVKDKIPDAFIIKNIKSEEK